MVGLGIEHGEIDRLELGQTLRGPGHGIRLDRFRTTVRTDGVDLEQLEQISGKYPSRERFLTELTLDPPSAAGDQSGDPLLDEDYLILSTIHSAKGQEWRSVFVLNVVDGCIPSDMSTGRTEDIEEERRLLYVAMTRAKDDLHLIMPQRFYVHQQRRGGDRHVYAARSRFIASDMLDHFADIDVEAYVVDGFVLANDFETTSEEDGGLRENSDRKQKNLFGNLKSILFT